jgi:DNA-binding NarL/FixJ family response regulator
VLLVARLVAGFQRAAVEGRFLDERAERFREAVPRVMERYGGYADPFNDRITARFDGPARALHAALALREAADSLGFSIAQGIHVGEIDISSKPLSGSSLEIADRIAAAARAPDILLSRLASDLVSGSGLQFVDRGTLVVKGVRDPLPLVALAPERHLEPVLRKRRPADLDTLSPREREVLALVADGLSNPHIAVQLGLSEHTIKRHVANILLKLDLPTRTAAAAVVARQPVR